MQKWTLLSKTDISPSKWFPLEKRVYQLPNGKIVDDFIVSTLADVSMIVPITRDKKVVLIKLYKQGVDEIIIQFPAGRFEKDKHADLLDTAVKELEEETGIRTERPKLKFVGKLSGLSTKATEIVNVYLVEHVEINSMQKLDETEEIEILQLSFQEMDEMIADNKIWCALTISAWTLVRGKL